ncbi:MAG: hypothetical protein GWP59_03370 [Chlamydiales bacterium]|nr:hypothetical protein [Chlamydiales bacterium]NCF70725.1 hypothetical protein [Chlamydiales bacterium]
MLESNLSISTNEKENIKEVVDTLHLFADGITCLTLSQMNMPVYEKAFTITCIALRMLSNRILEKPVRDILKASEVFPKGFTRKVHLEGNPYYFRHSLSLTAFTLQLGAVILNIGRWAQGRGAPSGLTWVSASLVFSSRPALHLINRGPVNSISSLLRAL